MNRLTTRSAKALFLLLTALLLTLTCATATATYITYLYYDQEGIRSTREAIDIKSFQECLDDETGVHILTGGTPDNPMFFYVDTGLDGKRINVVSGEAGILLRSAGQNRPLPPVFVSDQTSLSLYNVEEYSGKSNATSIRLGAGSTLNLNSANLNLNDSISLASENLSGPATVNIYGGTHTITGSTDGEPGIGQGIELNIFGGELFITGGGGQPALDCTSLTFSPSSGFYILVYDSVDKDTRKLIGAYNQSNSDGALDTLRKYTALSMEKAVMSTIVIDQTPQTYLMDESPRFEVRVLTEGVSPSEFTVEYRQNGSYSTNPPTQPGTYDVRITRAADDTYATVNQVIPGALVITGRSLADLPQTGDSSRLTGWLALLGASYAGLWCLNRRRG